MHLRYPTDWFGRLLCHWVQIALCAVFLICIGGCFQPKSKTRKANDAADAVPPVQLLPNNEYQEVDARIDFTLKSVRDEIARTDLLAIALEEKLAALGDYLSRKYGSDDVVKPSFIGESFTGSGIDRSQMVSKFDDGQIEVERWVASESAPKFTGTDAFQNIISNAFDTWHQATDFELKFKVANVLKTDRNVSARVVVESFGQKDATSGLQATSLWQTDWEQTDDGSLSLTGIRILGREELKVAVDGGNVFADVSELVFRNLDAWQNQLQNGISDWAKVIRGINVLGNQGLSLQDINGDGLCDIYICEPHGLPNLLFLQKPDGTVEEVGAKSGVNILDECRSALIIDLDNDGDQDLAIASDQNLVLLSNDGECRFRLEHKLRVGAGGTSLAAADFDLDGDLDLFLCRDFPVGYQSDIVLTAETPFENQTNGRNVLLRNDEGWKFSDVTDEVGLSGVDFARSKSATWIDYDGDGDQDLVIANEWSSSRLFENRDGWFIDVSSKLDQLQTARHRSVSVADFNRDAMPDFFLSSESSTRGSRITREQIPGSLEAIAGGRPKVVSPSVILRSQKAQRNNRAFEKYFLPSPVFSTESAFGSAVVDINNDGLEDLLVANGVYSGEGDDVESYWVEKLATFPLDSKSLKAHAANVSDALRQDMSLGSNQSNRSYLNLGPIGFANFSAASGIDFPGDTRAIASGDWDNDGDVDVVTLSRGSPRVQLFLNQFESVNQSVSIQLLGVDCNVDAIGAKVEVWTKDSNVPSVKWVLAQSGYLSQSSRRLSFGLGNNSEITKVDVTWPSGTKETFGNVQAGKSYQLREGTSNPVEIASNRSVLLGGPRGQISGSNTDIRLDYSPFIPPAVLPDCNIKSPNTSWCRLQNMTGNPMLMLFYDDSDLSASVLRQMSDQLDSFDSLGLVGAAIYCGTEGNIDAAVSRSKSLMSKIEWPFPQGAIPAQELGKLELAFRDWFGSGGLPKYPFALLTHSDGLVQACLPAELISKPISTSLARSKGENDALNLSNQGIEGFWVQKTRHPNADRLALRFRTLGLDDVAEKLEERTRESLAERLALRATSFIGASNFPKAKEFLDKAIEVDSRCLLAYLQRGHVGREEASRMPVESTRHAETLGAAARSFTLAMELDPSSEEAVIGFADVHVDMSLIDPAVAALRDFLDRFPESARVKAILGRLLFSTGQQSIAQRKEAATLLQSAFDQHPTLPFVAGDLGFIYLGDGDPEKAKEYLKAAHQQQPSDLNILRLYAESEFATSRFDKAVGLLEKYVEMKPSELRTTCMLAWILATAPSERNRNATRALELIEPLQKLQGDESAYVNEIAAACYAENGDFEKAIQLQNFAFGLVTQKNRTVDFYDEAKTSGLEERRQLYRDKLPYRMTSLDEIPIRKIDNRMADTRSLSR